MEPETLEEGRNRDTQEPNLRVDVYAVIVKYPTLESHFCTVSNPYLSATAWIALPISVRQAPGRHTDTPSIIASCPSQAKPTGTHRETKAKTSKLRTQTVLKMAPGEHRRLSCTPQEVPTHTHTHARSAPFLT